MWETAAETWGRGARGTGWGWGWWRSLGLIAIPSAGAAAATLVLLGGAEGASGAHWLWLWLETTVAMWRGMSPGGDGWMEAWRGRRAGGGAKKSCQREGQGILSVVHVTPPSELQMKQAGWRWGWEAGAEVGGGMNTRLDGVTLVMLTER